MIDKSVVTVKEGFYHDENQRGNEQTKALSKFQIDSSMEQVYYRLIAFSYGYR